MDQLLTSHDTLNDKFNKLLNDHEHLQNLFFSMEYDCQDLLKQLNKKNLINMNLNQEIDYLKVRKNIFFKQNDEWQVLLAKI